MVRRTVFRVPIEIDEDVIYVESEGDIDCSTIEDFYYHVNFMGDQNFMYIDILKRNGIIVTVKESIDTVRKWKAAADRFNVLIRIN